MKLTFDVEVEVEPSELQDATGRQVVHKILADEIQSNLESVDGVLRADVHIVPHGNEQPPRGLSQQ